MKIFIIGGSLLLALTVLSGAFGAHILKEKISIDYLRIYEKGIQYQAYHSIALILIGLLGYNFPHQFLWFPALCFILGIILFSGSLYLLAVSNIKWIGMLTPIGGLSFILGWIYLAWIVYRN